MKKCFLILILPFMLTAQTFIDRDDSFDKAAAAYTDNQFSQALTIYEEMYENDVVSFELYYNMANCYYRLADLGHAVLFWEKAALLDPKNQDLQHNLKLASLKMQDKVVLPAGFLLFEWYWAFRAGYSLANLLFFNGLFLFVLISLIYFPKSRLLSTSIQIRLKRAFRYPLWLSFFLLFILSTMSWDKYRYDSQNEFAIVIPREIRVNGEPREAANVLFLLHAGSKVKIMTHLEDWLEISYFDDKVG